MFRSDIAARRPLLRSVVVGSVVVALLVAALARGRLADAQTASEPTAGTTVVVATDGLNLRARASTAAEILMVLPEGASASVVGGPVSADGYDWYQLDVAGTTGWSATAFLASPASADDATTSAGFLAASTVAVAADELNLRDEAGLGGGVVDVLPSGTTATVVGGPENVDGYDWYQVETDAGSGWVAGDYLTAAALGGSGFGAGTAVVVDTDGLNLRAAAGLAAAIVTELANGTTATITADPVDADGYTWYPVATSAGSGWVAGAYLTAA